MASSSGCVLGVDATSLPGAARKGASVCRSEAPGPDQRFPRSRRLTARKQFLEVYAEGRRVRSRSFLLFGLPNAAGTSRLGLTVSRKFGNAAQRNRAKRLLREVFRTHRHRLQPDLDLVINARAGLLDRSYESLEREFLEGFARLAARFRR